MTTTVEKTRMPRVEIFETPEEVTLRVEMPGVAREDFDINVDGDELSIRGKRRPVNSGFRLVRGGIDNSDYYRAFTLGDALDASSVKAKLENGILTLTLAKKPEILPRKIEVNVG